MSISAKRLRIAIATLIVLALIVGGAVAGEEGGRRGEGGGERFKRRASKILL
jgi:hypothetical protein